MKDAGSFVIEAGVNKPTVSPHLFFEVKSVRHAMGWGQPDAARVKSSTSANVGNESIVPSRDTEIPAATFA